MTKAVPFILPALLSLAAGLSTAGNAPAYDAKLVAETRAFVAAIPKVLEDPTLMRIAEHSKWANSIVARSQVFLGTQSDLARARSAYGECQKATYWARELWAHSHSYRRSPNQADYKGIQLFTASYEQAMRDCLEAGNQRK